MRRRSLPVRYEKLTRIVPHIHLILCKCLSIIREGVFKMQRTGPLFRTCFRAQARSRITKLTPTRIVAARTLGTCRITHFHSRWLGNQPMTCSPGPVWKLCFSNSRLLSSQGLPAHYKITLPALSPTMEMGTVVRWEKQEGDSLSEGDLLCEIETDKATMGFETPEEGFLARIFVEGGAKDIPVGRLLCIIAENEENISAFKDFKDSGEIAGTISPAAADEPKLPPPPPKPTPSIPPPAPPPPPTSAPSTPITLARQPPSSKVPTIGSSSQRVFASPLAKRLAAQRGINLTEVSGSGPGGRVRRTDVETFTPSVIAVPTTLSSLPGAVYTDVPSGQLRQFIASRVTKSKQTIPHYFLTMEIDVGELARLRDDLNQSLAGDDVQLTLSDFVVKGTALASLKVPEANSVWMEDRIRQYHHVDINLTVQTEEGMMTPVIFNADTKGIGAINQESRDLAERCLTGSLKPEEYQAGTITVSDLSSLGVKQFATIINPNQSCVVAIGDVREVLLPDEDSQERYRATSIMNVTISCDHRVIDGAVGAQWLQKLKQLLEKPHLMLL